MIQLIAREGAVLPEYAELALDSATWDLAVPVRWIYGADALVQRIKCRLRFFLGEWYLDERLGLPWLEQVLGKGRVLADVNSIFTRAIRTTPGIRSVRSFSSVLDRPTRTLYPTFDAELAEGSLLAVRNEPFILHKGAQP